MIGLAEGMINGGAYLDLIGLVRWVDANDCVELQIRRAWSLMWAWTPCRGSVVDGPSVRVAQSVITRSVYRSALTHITLPFVHWVLALDVPIGIDYPPSLDRM